MTKSEPKSHYDVVIAGGGLVGASLACALAPLGKRVAVIESVPLDHNAQPSYDERVTAVAWGSRLIFQGLNVWQDMAAEATQINTVHVSESGRFGITRLTAVEAGVEALGYVVPNRAIGRALVNRVRGAKNIDWICPDRVTNFSAGANHVDVECESATDHTLLRARLLVAADGARSGIREQLGITPRIWDYAQTALVSTVTPSRPHRNVAYERFTRQGPIAMLPLPENRCGLVWSIRREQAEQLATLDEDAFCMKLGAAFGKRLGNFAELGARHCYPLHLVNTSQQVHERIVIVGNAAHSLHPIAGQGFNLSLRDVAVLAEVVADAADDPGNRETLSRYADWRRKDQRRMIAFTDALNRVFRNPLVPLGTLRSLGLLALDITPPLKRRLGRITMGVMENAPRLTRGVALQ